MIVRIIKSIVLWYGADAPHLLVIGRQGMKGQKRKTG